MSVVLQDNKYGKSRVRLMKVTRHAHGHDLREWNVQILLRGDFESCHTVGDNSQILPTDTMKNTVYSRARVSKAISMEEFAKELVDFLLSRNPQVSSAEVTIEAALWKRLMVDGKPYPTAFMHGSNEVQTAVVEREQKGEFTIVSGLRDLLVLKTTQSGFVGYIKDELTTLPETTDRLFGTSVSARWSYTKNSGDFDGWRKNVRESMLAAFAKHDSLSVQHTLYAMGEAVLNAVPEVVEIDFTLPNKHCLLVDLSRFGQDNPNEIFVPTDEPHGTIQARVARK